MASDCRPALDNPSAYLEEWQPMINQVIYGPVPSPSDFEMEQSEGIFVEQIIRPTGLMEPEIDVRPLANQIDDLIEEIRQRIAMQQRILVLTLTKRMSEELAEYLKNLGIRAAYMHSELDAIERIEVLYRYRRGDFDVLVGINLLREATRHYLNWGLVGILDDDKRGVFARQKPPLNVSDCAGLAARANVHGKKSCMPIID